MKQPWQQQGGFLDRIGLVDVLVPAVRTRLERVDADEVVEDVVDYIRRTPEVLVVILGSLTVTTGLIVYLMRRAEDEARREQRSERATTKRRTAARKRSSYGHDKEIRSIPEELRRRQQEGVVVEEAQRQQQAERIAQIVSCRQRYGGARAVRFGSRVGCVLREARPH